jgi:hypothetical protein
MSPAETSGGYRHRPRDQQLLEGLLVGATPEQAADRAGVSRATAYRRLAHPGFVAELRRQQEQILAQLRRRTVASTIAALTALRDIINDETVPAAARVSAARVILERADPVPTRVEAAVAVAAAHDRPAKDILAEALERARTRLELPVYAGDGHSGNGSNDG